MWPADKSPSYITVSALVFILVLAVIRIGLVRRASQADHLINIMAGIAAVGVLLREPAVARQLARFTPGGLPTIFDAWHWTTVISWATAFGLWLLREYGPVRYRPRYRLVLAGSAGIGIVLLVLSSPARSRGISIADYGGWRYGAYIALLSVLPIVVSALMSRTLLALRQRATTRHERVVVRILFIVIALSVLPVSSLILFATLNTVGFNVEIVRQMYRFTSDGLASGEPQLLFCAILGASIVPSCTRAVMCQIRLFRLRSLWRELTAAAPEVVLSLKWADRWGASPAERVERRRIEIHDAAEIIARFTQPPPVAIDELITATVRSEDRKQTRDVLALIEAARCLSRNDMPFTQPAPHGIVVPDEDVLRRLWSPAKRILRAATRLPQPVRV
ncbi:DUF6545 domain-containing protein [Nocardia terpenica]|uniref:DUF6545 domain-containing protein n=1 Tax=Nocardia terpenica TaxID=455432 RepID=A0A164JHB7_9NOCA|nr:DUF6545 domain-containing protein [Nocardia terpenica]KZM70402.1 hypothetical protein AWN90_03725 [Nocardia terpenica]NQE91083.1 hypothetical protein [Nocardia terpenica]